LILLVETSGPDPDSDGYTLLLDGTTRHALPVAGTTTVTDLLVGEHAIAITDIATNCTPTRAPPPTVTIAAETEAMVTFRLVCGKILRYDLAYEDVENGDTEIFLRPATGGPPTNLTRSPARDGEPSWSPDGRRLAFSSQRSGNGDIYVMEGDGSAVVRLTTTDGIDHVPRWSPDGSRILFRREATVGSEPALFVMNADGSGEFDVSPGAGWEDQGEWSPDGRRIAFVSTRNSIYSAQLHLIDADGSNIMLLGEELEQVGSPAEPDWSPDGGQIAFWLRGDNGWNPRTGIYQISADGTNLVQLKGDGFRYPRWSPDGTQLLISTVGARSGDIYEGLVSFLRVRDVVSGGERTLQPESEGYQVFGTWAPDGKLISFCDGSLAVIAPDGTGFTELLPYCAAGLAWRPSAP
jgi:Tol biopolymer transport system component